LLPHSSRTQASTSHESRPSAGFACAEHASSQRQPLARCAFDTSTMQQLMDTCRARLFSPCSRCCRGRTASSSCRHGNLYAKGHCIAVLLASVCMPVPALLLSSLTARMNTTSPGLPGSTPLSPTLATNCRIGIVNTTAPLHCLLVTKRLTMPVPMTAISGAVHSRADVIVSSI
jgi:hypothetical protein